ncbi:hypothetical protein HETIRDRAFT_448177 [Heterobasidion irregulare TC 32-1]|uniref:PSP1 C-terminal domain-containing protein n=1 Tax=Heterobasidion irregulare (strain TC 32-1) TaxID=747525 RepID=W4KPJ2_HETIT|nr:uncharacterized protein HETIRDRAFT_448177 [Heterobasidion irregulare TC 32-1]ETW87732.1 hypothetical protein HETIRDRAFT_448177 [Heterobasidion irregulare TC 32-1]
MMPQSDALRRQPSDDADRRNRFVSVQPSDPSGPASLRERAASQPPRSSSHQPFLSSPQAHSPSLGRTSGSPWLVQQQQQQRFPSALSPGTFQGLPQSVPTRSSSFSATSLQGSLSALRESRTFASTFEDDESEAMSDTYDERYLPPSLPARGRSYAADLTRSRSQSLATTRPAPIGSQIYASSGLGSWAESGLASNPLNIPAGPRYADLKPPGSSRYGSLGTLARSPSNAFSSSPSGPIPVGGNTYGHGLGAAGGAGNGYSSIDISNMSPFVRDVGQILLDDGSAFRELWAGMNPPRDENGGGGSGTTSRRHSVSVVQPRRGIVGFHAPGIDSPEEPARPFAQAAYGHARSSGGGGGGGGLLLTDEDLADDLGLLSLGAKDGPGPLASVAPPSQPLSLPIYAPLSRSPPSASERAGAGLYSPLNLSIPGGGGGAGAGAGGFSSAAARQQHARGSPSDQGSSPSRGQREYAAAEYFGGGGGGGGAGDGNLTARFIPGQGIQYLSQQALNEGPVSGYARAALAAPISPGGARGMHHQQQQHQQQQSMFSSPIQRRPSDAGAGPGAYAHELGKGVPLHAVPASCPLYIVEFKAGRTDLFYATEAGLDVRAGDLVIVEADRGKDLGTVVNDTITLAQVEAFQREQVARAGFGSGGAGGGGGGGEGGAPLSPGGSAGGAGKKEINPKMIYGKAQPQDTQLLAAKIQDEMKALQLCQTKVRQKKLPMEVIDAEYQWDRRKLTFYFVAEKRIDFRELVRELFRCAASPSRRPQLASAFADSSGAGAACTCRLYKTRIWMASLQGPARDWFAPAERAAFFLLWFCHLVSVSFAPAVLRHFTHLHAATTPAATTPAATTPAVITPAAITPAAFAPPPPPPPCPPTLPRPRCQSAHRLRPSQHTYSLSRPLPPSPSPRRLASSCLA